MSARPASSKEPRRAPELRLPYPLLEYLLRLPGDYANLALRLVQRAQWAPTVSQTGVPIDAYVRITRNDAARDLANGDRFTVAAVTPTSLTLSNGKRDVELPTHRPLHLDHTYATTVHASQGTTADRVLIDATTKSRNTAKDVYHVAISRAQLEARIYTDDRSKLPAAVGRDHVKHAALDLERS